MRPPHTIIYLVSAAMWLMVVLSVQLINDTKDLCKICSLNGGECFTLNPTEAIEAIEKKGKKLAFQCVSDKIASNREEHDVRELHQGGIDVASTMFHEESISDESDLVLRISSFINTIDNGKNLFIHVRDEFHEGYAEAYEFNNQAEYEGKSRADALLKVVHEKIEG